MMMKFHDPMVAATLSAILSPIENSGRRSLSVAAAGGAELGEKLDFLFMQTMGDVGDSVHGEDPSGDRFLVPWNM